MGATVHANDHKLLVGNPFHEIKYNILSLSAYLSQQFMDHGRRR